MLMNARQKDSIRFLEQQLESHAYIKALILTRYRFYNNNLLRDMYHYSSCWRPTIS